MKEVTYQEFEKALANARWPKAVYCHTELVTDVFYNDRGTEVAHKIIIRKRGKVIDTRYYVSEGYL